MADIYVCGHGGWGTVGRSSVFVKVPQGTEVIFYKEIGDVLYVDEAEAILSKATHALQPARTISALRQCPDMSLYPAMEHWKSFGSAAGGAGSSWHGVSTTTRLSYFLQRYPGSRIHWIACSVRELK